VTWSGVYLLGSVALGCYGPHSDVDVLVAIRQALRPDRQRSLAELCLAVSHASWDDAHCLLELDVVVPSQLWRYPPPLEFHYGESLREPFERDKPKPWGADTWTDLACALTIVHAAGIVLEGEPVADALPRVPLEDYRAAILVDRQWCLDHLETHRLLVVLSLPRVWAGMETTEVHSKASAAEWALPRLPPELRPVIEHGLAVYRGDAEESWTGLPVDDYIAWVVEQIP
jgi:aminoglycoside adenylyltransferase-like protein/nucleotidyltransferase-like protein